MGELYGDRAAPQLAGINLRQKLLNAASFRPNFPALFASIPHFVPDSQRHAGKHAGA